ncbi:unnamed protein product [Adineta ricciae]|uniref:Uncharacterized protein n=1 Tax=Adineta ricciae TaxID=249248 RepID=A0A814GGK2_ADIRI|nr:unnamed protein product [Adineta ricciae]
MTEEKTNLINEQLSNVNSLIRRRLNNLSSAISNRLWLNAHTNYECDVLLTFPTRVDDYGLVWFLEQLLQLAPDIRISIKYHFTTGEDIFSCFGVYGFYVTFTYKRLLQGAHEIQLQKPIKQEFGGGYKIFIFDELEFYDGVEDEQQFLTTQERQSIVRHLLYSIRIVQNQEILGIKFNTNHSLIQRALEKGLIRQLLPLHNKDTLNHLRETWVWPQAFFKQQPIGKYHRTFLS